MAMSAIPLIELKKVSKIYPMGETEVVALNDVSLKIFSGESITIVGSSGSGKSTLLHILGLLDRPSRGRVYVNGKNIEKYSDSQLAKIRNQTIGFVFQQFNLLSRTTVFDNVLLPYLYNSDMTKNEAIYRAKKLLEQMGLASRLNHAPNQLSGGQQQRVAIARALMCNPKIILADEPTGNLDSKTGKEIIDLLFLLQEKQGKTLVLVTHEKRLAKLGERKIFIADGKIVKKEK